jgi:hypothetical protein
VLLDRGRTTLESSILFQNSPPFNSSDFAAAWSANLPVKREATPSDIEN